MYNFGQPGDEKSPVPKRSENSGSSRELSMGSLQFPHMEQGAKRPNRVPPAQATVYAAVAETNNLPSSLYRPKRGGGFTVADMETHRRAAAKGFSCDCSVSQPNSTRSAMRPRPERSTLS